MARNSALFWEPFRAPFGLAQGPPEEPKMGLERAQDGFGAGLPSEAVFGPILGPFWEPPEP